MSYSPGHRQFRQVMVFIDGGYLRPQLREHFRHDRFNLFGLVWGELVGMAAFGSTAPELVRTYYYDAVFPEGDAERIVQNEYFSRLRKNEFTQIRLGRLARRDGGPPRQKGVDVLMAIDMLGKADRDQFDIAIVLAGDDDFLDIVQAVRDAGKRVYGAYFEAHTSQRLIDSFDRRRVLTKELLSKYSLSEDWKTVQT
jgi:uncharacterized LabA/DUF88 family protein